VVVRGGLTRRRPPEVGLRPTLRFALAAALTGAWVAFAVVVSAPWRGELEDALGPVLAWVIPTLLAYVPGLVIGFVAFTLLLTPYHELPLAPPSGPWPSGSWPAVAVLVAAWNEERTIGPTIDRLADLTYPGELEVVLADNNSTDRTAELAAAAAERRGLRYRRVFTAEQGKFHALNGALETVTSPVAVTLDADTYVHREALTRLVARLGDAPQGQHVSACAGALVAANAFATFVTRMQQWDYRLGINGVKRMQAAYNCTLVAQGAFSA
jgi:biofilm PGA synthesis N-glycosyltransferase PgaC